MTQTHIVYASTNAGKIVEARAVLSRFGVGVTDLKAAAQAAGMA